MSDIIKLDVEPRERAGKGASRAARREGFVPAVIYGGKKEPENIKIERRVLEKLLNTGTFFTSVFDISAGKDTTRSFPRDVQFHPVTSVPMHVDFLRLEKGASIDVEVPVNFLNEEKSPALKAGGVLNVVRYAIEVSAPVDAIPDGIDIDLSGLEVGDSVHISEVTLPAGVTPTITDRDFTIATVVAPSAMKSAEDEEADAPAADEVEATAQSGDDDS
ncbi:MAG: 50S ribosomal protein L25/general stress protein Ctc [Pseudomonadota bacterium]